MFDLTDTVSRVDDLVVSSPRTPGAELRARLADDGYLLLRRALDPARVGEVRAAVLGALRSQGWLASEDPGDTRPSERARREEVDLDPSFFDAYVAIQRLQALHELAHEADLLTIMRGLIDDPLLVHPRKIVRIGLPKDPYVVAAHQDFPLIQGTVDTLTAWIPLGDCPDDLGGLRVLPGSQRGGLRAVRRNERVGGLETAERLDDEPGWRTADFEAGDALVFHSLTVHAAKANRTDRLRLSADFRYQSATDPINEGSLVPHYHPQVPDHGQLTEGWTADNAVAVPAGARVVPGFDPFGEAPPFTSRLVSLDA